MNYVRRLQCFVRVLFGHRDRSLPLTEMFVRSLGTNPPLSFGAAGRSLLPLMPQSIWRVVFVLRWMPTGAVLLRLLLKVYSQAVRGPLCPAQRRDLQVERRRRISCLPLLLRVARTAVRPFVFLRCSPCRRSLTPLGEEMAAALQTMSLICLMGLMVMKEGEGALVRGVLIAS
jgi:hypothetical protein